MAGLYLHIPFCSRKCPYCDFFSVQGDSADIQEYVGLLIRQLTQAAVRGWKHPVESIYFGGGTPSLLTPQQVTDILTAIRRDFTVAADVEVSLEANPGTVTREILSGYRSAGVNRLSLGLQSCDRKQLRTLGRLHTREEGFEAITWAREAGFDNLSLDLMFALPGQSIPDLEEEISTFLGFQPEHLSCYGLTAEPQTPFHKQVLNKELVLPDEELYAEAFLLLHNRLKTDGYLHYEIANYAREGATCRHNFNYWQRGPYLGIGAGAHSFFSDGWGSRWQNPPDLQRYRQMTTAHQNPMECLETFSRNSALHETVYLALRTHRGIDNTELVQNFGNRLEELFPEAIEQSAQWLFQHDQRWSFTPEGWLLFDRLILPFL